MKTLRSAFCVFRDSLTDQGVVAAEFEAKLLISKVLACSTHDVLLDGGRPISTAEYGALDSILKQRLSGVPVARLLGEWSFWGLPFSLNDETLIPRADSETLIEVVLERIDSEHLRYQDLKILDIGVGSGALGIALLSELPNASCVGLDISEAALSISISNALRNNVGMRYHAVVSDYAEGLSGLFDIIISNPPYISEAERVSLSDEVLDHDPECALFESEDGLYAYQKLFPFVKTSLKLNGFAVFEHGYRQGEAVRCLARKSGLNTSDTIHDLGGNPRCLMVW